MEVLTPRSCCLQEYQFVVVYPATEEKGLCAVLLNWKALVRSAKPFPLQPVKDKNGSFLMLDPSAPQNEAFKNPAMEAARVVIDKFLEQAKCKTTRALVSSDDQVESGSRSRRKTKFYSPTEEPKDRGNNGNGRRACSSPVSESQDSKAIISSVTKQVTETVTASVCQQVLEALEVKEKRRKTVDNPEKLELKRRSQESERERERLAEQVMREKDKVLHVKDKLLQEKDKFNDYLKEEVKTARESTMDFALKMAGVLMNNPVQGMKRKEPTQSSAAAD